MLEFDTHDYRHLPFTHYFFSSLHKNLLVHTQSQLLKKAPFLSFHTRINSTHKLDALTLCGDKPPKHLQILRYLIQRMHQDFFIEEYKNHPEDFKIFKHGPGESMPDEEELIHGQRYLYDDTELEFY